jgi:hypothetical protein
MAEAGYCDKAKNQNYVSDRHRTSIKFISSSDELRINIELEICKVNHLPEPVV